MTGTRQSNIAKTAYSRVFLIPGQAAPDHEPEYQSCLVAEGVSKSFGDRERIECPSTTEYGGFDSVDEIRGADEDATSSLMGRYALDFASRVLQLAQQKCPVDVQVHLGKCTDPRVFNKYEKALIWEDVALPSWEIDGLGALKSGENAAINESVDLQIGYFYEALQLTFQQRAPDVAINELVDAVFCDRRTCGDCDEYSEGCEKAFVLQGGVLGSPGTAPDVLYTSDGGPTWGTDEINVLTNAQTADGIACLGDDVLVVSNSAGSLSYKEKADILAGIVAGWTEITTGIVAGGEPNDIWSVGIGAFVVGDGGYAYYTEDASMGLTVLDAGVATSNNLNAVHALDDKQAVAVGDSDTIIYTTDRITWVAANATGGGANLNGVWMRTQTEWWVVDSNGDLWYTKDSGQSWTEKSIPGVSITDLNDIQFVTRSVGYICGAANGSGAAWRTINGGYSWVRLPEGVGTLPGSATAFNALATCINDPNLLILAGQDASNDGVLNVGKD